MRMASSQWKSGARRVATSPSTQKAAHRATARRPILGIHRLASTQAAVIARLSPPDSAPAWAADSRKSAVASPI